MSVVSLQLGQCGNQLGEEFFDSLRSEAARARPALAEALRKVYFVSEDGSVEKETTPWCPRAVLVDTEPRVVQRCLDGRCSGGGGYGDENGAPWCYDASTAVCRQGGAGNNWAHGFHMYGPAVAEKVLDATRRQVERCDQMDGFLVFQSVAGGTGSGLGSHALQLLRDAFPAAPLVTVCVWPFESGEVSVQSYNAVLSLAAAYEYADMMMLCENQRYMEICRSSFRDSNPSFPALNKAICGALLPALMPCRAASAPLGAPARPLLRLAGHLCAHPLYRLVTARSLPQVARGCEAFASDSWAALQRQMVHICEASRLVDRTPASAGVSSNGNVAAPAAEGTPAPTTPAVGGSSGDPRVGVPSGRSSGVVLAAGGSAVGVGACTTARGTLKGNAVASTAFLWGKGAVEAPLDGLRRLPAWRLALDPLQVYADPHELGAVERSVGLLSNCKTPLPALEAARSKAAAMLHAGAYMHQYERYGVTREGMSEALLSITQVCHDYNAL
eukprot:TRINITY_DN56326_c0_g1_i1.p1 TRINITY_DN56326_c0_g1~~TRINITY_DN56326_c0_g1_i1.p1  ORF type:complete len:501 (+),score=93.90 TRINITY_DN56326_c0_g1_i1:168-1670(+)